MVDLVNRELIKIMWLPGEREILFDIKTETPIPIDTKVYKIFGNFIDLPKWISTYAIKYNAWLTNDDPIIYNIKSSINLEMIDALVRINKILNDTLLFYLFDIDRTFTDAYNWEFCPISGKKLIELELSSPKINSLISPDYPLIFPTS